MEEQVKSVCEQLVRAVTVIMEPESSKEYRLEALKFCEDFKENNPDCVVCGLHLAEKTQLPVIRHFGLQVLEHVVKFRWNNMSQADKTFLKGSVLELISKGIHSILEEEGHIKDMLARIMVEMIKREWPQQWPNMLEELDALTKFGEAQTELVMLILLRLAEDVVTFQTLPTQRRRDIQSYMTQNMDTLFTFMLDIVQERVQQYQLLKTDPTNEEKSQSLCRVAVSALNTLAGYIDWVSIKHITAKNCILLQMLCLLLGEPGLQLEAAECLLIAVSRKGKMEDRAPLLVLFGNDAISCILNSAQMADGEILVEKRYVFLKRLCQILCALGSQICALISAPDVEVKMPENFKMYLESLLCFTRHPSQFLKSCTLATWGALFRHEVISRDPQLLAAVPEFLKISTNNIVKAGFPSKNDSPSCLYSRVDFDNDEDFNTFFSSFRATSGDVVRLACRLDPHTGFSMGRDWLRYQLTSSQGAGTKDGQSGEEHCSLLSPQFVQWDAMTFFCECAFGQMFRTLSNEELPVTDGTELLQRILSFETRDPLILSCILTNLSTVFPFISSITTFVPFVLSKLFKEVTFELVQDVKQDSRYRAVKNVRRHACSSIIKICRDYTPLVLPYFDLIYTHVKKLLQEELLTQMEKCVVMEAVVLVSNHFKNFERQSTFLAELLSPLVSIWLSEEVQRAISCPDEFIAFIGADKLRDQQVQQDVCWLNRSQITFCVSGILGLMKRACWPQNPEEAKAGGFLFGYTPSGSPIYRNPISAEVLKFLDGVCTLVRTLNNLYLPDIVQKMGDHYASTLDMLNVDKLSALGLLQPVLDLYHAPVYKTLSERLKIFLTTLYDNSYTILGQGGLSLQMDFYSVPDLASRLINSTFTNLDHVPDFRLRRVVRVFLKQFILSCPPEKYESLVCPILGPFLTYMSQRLSQKWVHMNHRSELSEEDCPELNSESQEVLDDQLLRLLTREVVDLVTSCCVSKKNTDHGTANTGADGVRGSTQADAEDEEMMATEVVPAGFLELTELGRVLMEKEEVSMALLLSAFSPLAWKDSLACQRSAIHLCWPLLKHVIASSLPADAALCFFVNVLRGLQTHGQHSGSLCALVHLAFQIYDNLRPLYPELRGVMEQIPGIQLDSLDQFDQRLLSPTQKLSDKKRKEHFKRLVHGCVEKPLGEQFRKEVHIRNLPSLFQKKPRPALDEDSLLGICAESLPAIFQP
ncbi:exportin-5 [Rhinophrynus dorsalis]